MVAYTKQSSAKPSNSMRIGNIENNQRTADENIKRTNQLMMTVVGVLIVQCVAIVISLIGIFLDQMRMNNAAYKDYSDQYKVLIDTEKTNQQLLNDSKKGAE